MKATWPSVGLLLWTCGMVSGLAAPPTELRQQLEPFLQQNCLACHEGTAAEAGLDLAKLSADLASAAVFAKWERIHDRVVAGEMPPSDADQPTPTDRKQFLRILADDLTAVHAQTKGTVLRRLNRFEYERTLNDLLGTRVKVAELLPEDGRAHGFDNIGAALDLSPVQLQRYMEAAAIALDACVSVGPRPEPTRQSFTFDTGRNEGNIGKSWLKQPDGAVVVATECCSPVKVYEMRISQSARHRVQLRVAAHRSEKPIVFRVHAGKDFFDSMPLFDILEALPGAPSLHEFEVWLSPGETIRLWPHLPTYWLPTEKIATYEGAGLALYDLTIEGPIYDEWPTRGHRLRFGDMANETAPGQKGRKPKNQPRTLQLASANPAADLARVLPTFLTAAFRRPVDAETAEPFIAIGQQELVAGATLEQALRTAQIAALCSPDFLFLWEPAGRLDDYALAARLSYMLWGVPPDAVLRDLAEHKKLGEPTTLHAQTERLLNDPRAKQFTQNFVGQWLNLRDIDFTTPDKQLYPEYDPLLRHAMLRETELFFDEVLQNNRSLLEFIDSDWTYLNERLANHYGIDGVSGVAMRKVSLQPEHRRGGVLTHGSVLKVSANGTTTSPVVRGAYVLERLLGVQPPPPPPNVPGVEPDIRGATTLREQLAKHRSEENCNSCHRIIDPPGFALESYDVIGGWRANYRSLGKDFPKPEVLLPNGKGVTWRIGPIVNAAGETADGKPFADLQQYKQILLSNPKQVAAALTEKLLTYGTGRGMGFSDRPEIQRLVASNEANLFRFRDLLHQVIQSELFRTK